jgi:UDP-N-acetylglucosamine--N-acetylmuramyl-(pentapeptide) pyrophosphoryl-undecaprenol N-acetylglucosamine transferase
MRVAFCGGGTGGHVYPALTVAAALRRRLPEDALQMLYVGVAGRMDEDLVSRENIPFRAVAAGPLRVGSPTGAAKGLLKLGAGAIQASAVLRRFRPDVVFATGGYGSVGVGLATRLRGCKLVLFLPDVEAGLAVKTLAKLAARIAVTNDEVLKSMPPGKTVLTGYPVRPEFFATTRDEARRRLNLHPTLPTLLVAGGSTGASAINQAVAGWAADFLRLGQLIHICGHNDEAWLRTAHERLSDEERARYHLHAYIHEGIADAFAAADIAVMRAGASTLGELPATRLPAILVPGAFSDQDVNARYLAGKGAAVVLLQDRLDDLKPLVLDLLGDTTRRQSMRDALASLARPDAADRLADLIIEAANAPQVAA